MGLGSFLFGKKKEKGYKSPYTGQYEKGVGDVVTNRLGGSYTTDKKGKRAYDFSGVQPLQGAAGIQKATEGYDFSPVDQAISGFQKPTTFTQTYKPSQFNFTGLPDQYGSQAYEMGAKNLRREGAGDLTKLQETIGTRRPGLLFKAAQDSQRQTGEREAELNQQIALQKMQQDVELNKAQQEAQAGENYRGFQSESDRERANEANRMQALEALQGAGMQKIGAQSDLVGQERAYQDQAIEWLMNLFNTGVQSKNSSAQIANAGGGGGLFGKLGSLANAGASIYKTAKG